MLGIRCPECNGTYQIVEIKQSPFCRKCGKYLSESYIIDLNDEANREIIKEQIQNETSNDFEKTYLKIKQTVPDPRLLDSLIVAKKVEEYRQFWKPQKVNVILLAESHVYTNDEEFALQCRKDLQDYFIKDYPTNFVRFVYCLCSGEPEMFRASFKHKRHTQFWKIFCSCIAKTSTYLKFERILKRETTLNQRLTNKVSILKEMHDRGIWLLDA